MSKSPTRMSHQPRLMDTSHLDPYRSHFKPGELGDRHFTTFLIRVTRISNPSQSDIDTALAKSIKCQDEDQSTPAKHRSNRVAKHKTTYEMDLGNGKKVIIPHKPPQR